MRQIDFSFDGNRLESDRTGWQLGSDPEIQVATVVNNHLTSGILKYFGDAFRQVFQETVACTNVSIGGNLLLFCLKSS